MIRTSRLSLLLALAVATPAVAQPDDKAEKTASVRKIQQVVEEMRGLRFQVPVTIDLKTPDGVRAMIVESFEKEAPAEELSKQEKVYKAFGLIPADYDLRAKMIDFLSENIGGYYDPEAKQLFLVDMTEKMQGLGPMAKLQDDMVIAHEVYHALQDQTFDLSRWFGVLGDHEDRVQAYKSLVEGEAQLVGMTYMFKKMGQPNVDLKQINKMQKAMVQMSPEGQKIREIPPFLVENMMFPYTQGAEWVQHIQRTHGWDRLAAAFADPPTSTEQILHPEKFLGERDEPAELELANLAPAFAKETDELWGNTLGEFNVSILLRALGVKENDALRIAAGWDGDTYQGFETPDGRVVLVWLSTWDSEAEAHEFEEAYRTALNAAGKQGTVVRRGTEVLLISGSQGAEEAELLRRGFEAVAVEMKFRPLSAFTAQPPVTDFNGEPEAVAGATGATPEGGAAASSAGLGATLLHVDELGATFPVLPGFEAGDDPITALQNYAGAYFAGPDGAELRLVALPIPFEAAKTQLEALLQQGNDKFEMKRKEDQRVGGRDGLFMEFQGALPGASDVQHSSVLAISAGGTTLLVASTVPQGDARGPNQFLHDLLQGLWLDGAPGGKIQRHTAGSVSFELPQGFQAVTGPGEPVVASLEHTGGVKVQVVRQPEAKTLADAAQTLTSQLPLVLEGYEERSNGITSRAGRQVHELEYQAGGRRTRQLTLVQDGVRYTVACSAPEAAFALAQPAFGRILATFEVGGAAQPAQPVQPEQPAQPEQPERRLY